ncbi:MAG: hypothetical protein QM751_14075 [Paludibacteraceae bacterium]
MKKTGIILFLAIILLESCSGNEDKVQDISKEGSVETSIEIEHLNDTADVMITRSRVWVRGGLVKTLVRTDTLPTLGFTMQEAENNNGETQNVFVKKDYEVYLTIK